MTFSKINPLSWEKDVDSKEIWKVKIGVKSSNSHVFIYKILQKKVLENLVGDIWKPTKI